MRSLKSLVMCLWLFSMACGTELGNPSQQLVQFGVGSSSQDSFLQASQKVTFQSGAEIENAKILLTDIQFFGKNEKGDCDTTVVKSVMSQTFGLDLVAGKMYSTTGTAGAEISTSDYCLIKATSTKLPSGYTQQGNLPVDFLTEEKSLFFQGKTSAGKAYTLSDTSAFEISWNIPNDLVISKSTLSTFLFVFALSFVESLPIDSVPDPVEISLTNQADILDSFRSLLQKRVYLIGDLNGNAQLDDDELVESNVIADPRQSNFTDPFLGM